MLLLREIVTDKVVIETDRERCLTAPQNLTVDPLLRQADHRPWPLPSGPWIMTQIWRNLLFAHWRVPAAALRPMVTPGLELDTFDDHAWISVTPFHMSVRPRG